MLRQDDTQGKSSEQFLSYNMKKKSNCVEGLPVENKNVLTFSLTRPYLAGSEAPSVPELLQYASDQDCLSLQLVQVKGRYLVKFKELPVIFI